jgi:hypothetical protein
MDANNFSRGNKLVGAGIGKTVTWKLWFSSPESKLSDSSHSKDDDLFFRKVSIFWPWILKKVVASGIDIGSFISVSLSRILHDIQGQFSSLSSHWW